MGFEQLDEWARSLLIAATVLYLLGVQVPTIRGNLPLNNRLQELDLGSLSQSQLAEAREAFESSWNRLNHFRTFVCMIVAILLIVVAIMR
jgi:uncharacterized membrane protein